MNTFCNMFELRFVNLLVIIELFSIKVECIKLNYMYSVFFDCVYKLELIFAATLRSLMS